MKRAGFTLMEILIALSIVAVLTAVAGYALLPNLQDAKVKAAKVQLSVFKTSLEMYEADNGAPPTMRQGLDALVRAPDTAPVPSNYREGGYLDKLEVPADPWGRPYAYVVPGPEGKRFDVICYGADGQPGGEGANADLTCWR